MEKFVSDFRWNIYVLCIVEVFVDDVFVIGRFEVDVGDMCGRECLSLVFKESEFVCIIIFVFW